MTSELHIIFSYMDSYVLQACLRYHLPVCIYYVNCCSKNTAEYVRS